MKINLGLFITQALSTSHHPCGRTELHSRNLSAHIKKHHLVYGALTCWMRGVGCGGGNIPKTLLPGAQEIKREIEFQLMKKVLSHQALPFMQETFVVSFN